MTKRKKNPVDRPKKKQRTASESDVPENSNITSNTPSIPHLQKQSDSWTEDEFDELLKKVEANIPDNDGLSYSCRLEKLNWENIRVKNYSTLECKEAFNTLYKSVRKFRFLSEIVSDMKDLLKSQKIPSKQIKPKSPRNSFVLFIEDHREQVIHKHPLAHPNEVMKILAQQFRDLPREQKEKYNQLAKQERQEYIVKLQDFYKEHPEMVPKKKGKTRPVESDNPLEKPKAPFDLFVKIEGEKEEAPSTRFILVQKCREQWNEFTDKEKFFWIKWSEELYEKYLEDLKEYVKTHPTFKPEKVKYVLSKKEQQIRDRCCGKPDKPPYGAYHLFSRMILESEEVRHINVKDLMNYISEKWRSCPEKEKNEYKVRVEQMWEDYNQKLAVYLQTLPPEDRDRVREEERRNKKKECKVTETKKEEAAQTEKPKPPPQTAHKYFLQVYTGDEDANTVWKRMTEDEKNELEAQLEEKKRDYIVKYETYLRSLSRKELESLGATLANQDSSGESESESSSEDEP